MDLRYDAHASAAMAGALANDHAAYLHGRVGARAHRRRALRRPLPGPQGAAKLVEAYAAHARRPRPPPCSPRAAAVQPGRLLPGGQPAAVAQLYADLRPPAARRESARRPPRSRSTTRASPPSPAAPAPAAANASAARRRMLVDMILTGGGDRPSGPELD